MCNFFWEIGVGVGYSNSSSWLEALWTGSGGGGGGEENDAFWLELFFFERTGGVGDWLLLLLMLEGILGKKCWL